MTDDGDRDEEEWEMVVASDGHRSIRRVRREGAPTAIPLAVDDFVEFDSDDPNDVIRWLESDAEHGDRR